MKLTTRALALELALLATMFPAMMDGFKIASCGAVNCLPQSRFYTCDPSDLACICKEPQSLIDQYVVLVRPCLENDQERKKYCTDGALSQYKDLLAEVCANQGKSLRWKG